MEDLIPQLSQEEFIRYQARALNTISEYPFIRYGQALLNEVAKEHEVVFPELFYADNETAESLQTLLLGE